jgi:hypothetical protein
MQALDPANCRQIVRKASGGFTLYREGDFTFYTLVAESSRL